MNKYDRNKELTKLKELSTYEFLEESYIEELDIVAVRMEHKKNKAKILLMLTDDNNKVFTIGFRTPSIDSTGVAHIMEHSVLCGSRKFPLKDPFVEVVKGSLNTFLNAMTYPDKTLYPVASCNDKDFQNLMDVYLDAVLYPNIYNEEKIFMQEGWHYELKESDDELIINGVVYNEMKGAFSSADSVLERTISKGLFPKHSYGEESGGDPDCIPELSYEAFLDFHRRYYHPSNSYIYLYGDMDMAQKLEFIDKEYLSGFEYKELDSKIKDVEPFTEKRTLIEEYSVTEEENEENAYYLSLHSMVGGELEPVKAAGLKILEYILIDAPGAILREALQSAGIGEDCLGGYAHGIAYPYFSVIAKNAKFSQREEFNEIIKASLEKLAKEGMDRESLLAAINIAEFKAREADFGHYPKGLIYGLETFDSWLYDADPCMHLRYDNIFKELRKELDRGFFEKLIKELFLDNAYELELILKPVKNLTSKRDALLKEKLAGIKEKLGKEELKLIKDKETALKEYQKEENKAEDIAKLPVLKREEISEQAPEVSYEKSVLKLDGLEIPVIYSDINTAGISYVKYIFKVDFASREELKYLSLLREIFGYIDTGKYSYARLNTLINLHTGGLGFGIDCYADINDSDKASFVFTANSKLFASDMGETVDMIGHILLESKLDDAKRIKDIILEIKADEKSKILNAGHISALTKAGSYVSKDALFSELTKGIEFYRFIEDLSMNFEAKKSELIEKLIELSKKTFTADNMTINFVGARADFESFTKKSEDFIKKLEKTAERGEGFTFERTVGSEAYTSASRVNYVAEFGNYKNEGYEYTGVLRVLKVLLSYDYLWNNVRVIGGAYGAMSSFSRSGNVGLTSYRDPNVKGTYEIYDKVADFVRNFEADELSMRKLVIGAISELDTPMTPLTKGMKALAAYFSNIDTEVVKKERKEILRATAEDIRNLAPLLDAALRKPSRVSVGNEEKIKQDAACFDKVEALYKE